MHWQPRIISDSRSILVTAPCGFAQVYLFGKKALYIHFSFFWGVNYHPRVGDNHMYTMLWTKKRMIPSPLCYVFTSFPMHVTWVSCHFLDYHAVYSHCWIQSGEITPWEWKVFRQLHSSERERLFHRTIYDRKLSCSSRGSFFFI